MKHLELSEKDELLRILRYLKVASQVDITEFTIPAGNTLKSKLHSRIKRLIWKSLGFYTHRMWVQQNDLNGRIIRALDLLNSRLEQLESSASCQKEEPGREP